MEPTDNTGEAAAASRTPERAHGGAATLAGGLASDHPLGPHTAAILATEHWSLLATRSLIWNEAMSRATVFLTVLSASIIVLALLADATGFGAQTTTQQRGVQAGAGDEPAAARLPEDRAGP